MGCVLKRGFFFFLQGIAAAVVSTPTSLTAKPKVKKKKKVSFFYDFTKKTVRSLI